MRQGFFEDETEQKIDQIKTSTSAMLVLVRMRPLTIKEMSVNPLECARALDSKLVAMVDSGQDNQRKRSRETQFAFDFVFDKKSTNKQIYDECLTGFLQGVLQGFNSTILAYGATGCGKTYTQHKGQTSNQGLCALFLIDLLGRAQQLKFTHHVVLRLSYIEIYNQVIKDLLTSEDKILELRQDPKEGVCAHGATQVKVSSLVELSTLLKVGAANRSKESTGSNDDSSRSHAILLVKAQTREKARGIKEEVSIGKLSLVDLAGSERATGGKSTRQVEGGKINKSLLALGNCIQILAEGGKSHVPFRQSKLTRMLKQALGGNCRTAMVTCISPYSGTRQQTYNTLLYASRARNIGSSITRNVLSSQAHLSNYVSLIGNLKRQNQELKKQLKQSKNYSLPHLKVNGSPSQLEVDRLSGTIQAHFSKELSMIRAVHEINMKLDKAAFKLLKMQVQNKGKNRKKPKTPKLQKQQQKLQRVIEQQGQQKQTIQDRLQDIVLKRGTIVEQIKNGQWGSNQANGLFTHYRQKKIQMQLQEVKLRQLRITGERTLKQEMFELLGQQIKTRDRIIEQQRIIINKNNILNRITYSRLNQSEVIPKIKQNLTIPTKPSVLKNLSEDYHNQFIQKKRIPHHIKDDKQVIIKRNAKNAYSRVSEHSLDKKTIDDRDVLSPKKNAKRIKNNSPNPGSKSRRKHQQFQHIYMQR